MPETMETAKELTAEEKAKRNDEIRRNLLTPNPQDRVMLTQGILAQGPVFVAEAAMKVREFVEFEEGNDPYGEHDFGAFKLSNGTKCFWKIDDYAGYDGIRCILTLLCADEY